MRAVILAGGRGVRLQPLTYAIPKPLVPLGDKPILEEIIERLKACGVRDLIIAVGYRAELIESYFGDGASIGVHIGYVRESHPLGTAGPLSLVRTQFELPPEEPILAMNGDILTDLDIAAFADFHRASGHEVTIATREFRLQHPYGVVQRDGERIFGIVEKPVQTDTVSAGIYAFQPSVLDVIPYNAYYEIPDLINRLIADGRHVGAYQFMDEWIAIDGIEQLQDAARVVAERRHSLAQ